MVPLRARRLVRKYPAMRFANDELISIGNEALTEAGRRFDPSVQDDFERFASKRVRGAMLRFTIETLFGPSGGAGEPRPTVRAIHEADARDHDEPPREEPAAVALGVEEPAGDLMSETVARLRRKVAAHAMVVYDTVEQESGGEDALIAAIDLRRTQGILREGLAKLSDRQREVLRERIVDRMTLQEVAASRGGISTKTVQRDLDAALSALDAALTAARIDRAVIAG